MPRKEYFIELQERQTIKGLWNYETSGPKYKPTPTIMLKGEWLKELGFDCGDRINVECQGGKLIITKTDEVIVE